LITSSYHRLIKLFRFALLALGILFVVVYVVVALWRMGYPFELEWIEGSGVDHVQRILDGRHLYVKPSIEFTPFLYTPLYFYLSAAVAKLIGIGFVPLRLVSFAASVGSFAIIYSLVKRETGNWYSALLAVGVFAATFRISGAWFDIARPDMLFVFFALAAIYTIRFVDSWWGYILAGVFISLSFLTKQTALIIALPMALYCVIANWRRAIFFVGTAAIIIAGSTWLLDRISGGWYRFYVFEVPSEHYILKARYIFFWIDDLLHPLPIVCAVAVLYLILRIFSPARREGFFYLLMASGMIGAAWSGRLHSGGYLNTLLPAYGFIPILFGVAFHHVSRYLQERPADGRAQASELGLFLVYFVCTAQMAGLLYNPVRQIPTKADISAGWQLVKMMEGIEGEVYLPAHGFLPTYAGKKPYAHVTAIHDLLRGKDTAAKELMLEGLRDAVCHKRFRAIFIDKDEFIVDISKDYRMAGRVFNDNRAFWPVTGLEIRPEFLFVPKDDSALQE